MDLTRQAIKAVVLDMDGVLWKGSELLPGFLDLFQMLKRRSLNFILMTNNARRIPEDIQARFAENTIQVELDQILTSAIGTAAYLSESLPVGSSIYVIGEQGLRHALSSASFNLTTGGDQAAAVVVGLDMAATWEKLAEASYAISAGARFIGTNPDGSIPTERGNAPGNGALLAAIQAATGKQAEIVGKPAPYLYRMALHRLGTSASQTLAIGDRLDTDILGGKRAGMPTAVVLTGVTRRADLEAHKIQPDWIFEDLPDLIQAFET